MKAFLATNVMGSFAFDKKGKLIDKRLFTKKPEEIAEKLASEDWIPEEEELLSVLAAKGYKEVVCDKNLQFNNIGIVFEQDHLGKQILKEEFRSLAISLKWVTSQAELNEIISKVSVSKTKTQLRVVKRDWVLMRAVGVLDELDKVLNNFSERLREWYSLHFPELDKEIKSHENYAEVVGKFGPREKMKDYASLAKESTGMEFSNSDMKEVQDFARTILELYQRKKSVDKYLESACKEVVPNTAAVAGHVIAARMLSAAGGLEKLSRLPSSTIQVLGAERALFRHLKGEGKAPKYGILFAHPMVQQAPPEKRGKVARLISAKIFLASKTDFFSSEDKGSALLEKLEKDVKRA